MLFAFCRHFLGEQEGDQFFGLLFIILLLFAAGGFAWCRWPQGSVAVDSAVSGYTRTSRPTPTGRLSIAC
jgi:hypothetical protein